MDDSEPKLERKSALITGAGSGIGRAIAELYSAHGCNVVVVDIVPKRIRQVVEQIGSKNTTCLC